MNSLLTAACFLWLVILIIEVGEMKEVTRYETSDRVLFEDKAAAERHEKLRNYKSVMKTFLKTDKAIKLRNETALLLEAWERLNTIQSIYITEIDLRLF